MPFVFALKFLQSYVILQPGYPERHILDNVTVFSVKYAHIVVIETALYPYASDLWTPGERPDDEWRMRASLVAAEAERFFEATPEWFGLPGGLILSLGGGEQSISHRIRAVGK